MDDNGAVDRAAGLQAHKPKIPFRCDSTISCEYFPDTVLVPCSLLMVHKIFQGLKKLASGRQRLRCCRFPVGFLVWPLLQGAESLLWCWKIGCDWRWWWRGLNLRFGDFLDDMGCQLSVRKTFPTFIFSPVYFSEIFFDGNQVNPIYQEIINNNWFNWIVTWPAPPDSKKSTAVRMLDLVRFDPNTGSLYIYNFQISGFCRDLKFIATKSFPSPLAVIGYFLSSLRGALSATTSAKHSRRGQHGLNRFRHEHGILTDNHPLDLQHLQVCKDIEWEGTCSSRIAPCYINNISLNNFMSYISLTSYEGIYTHRIGPCGAWKLLAKRLNSIRFSPTKCPWIDSPKFFLLDMNSSSFSMKLYEAGGARCCASVPRRNCNGLFWKGKPMAAVTPVEAEMVDEMPIEIAWNMYMPGIKAL